MNQICRATLIGFLIICLNSQGMAGERKPVIQNNRWLSEIRTGILAHDVPIWSRSRKESGVDFNAELIFGFFNYPLLSGSLRPNVGISLNSNGDTSKVYAGMLWEYVWPSGIFLNLGLGLAAHDGKLETREEDSKELGSRILFRIPVEFGLAFAPNQRLSIMFDHVSNAYLADPNEGLDTIGLRYSYQF